MTTSERADDRSDDAVGPDAGLGETPGALTVSPAGADAGLGAPAEAGRGGDEGPEPDDVPTWRWREDRSTPRNVLYAGLVALGVSGLAAVAAELVARSNRTCEFRGPLACAELAALIAFGVPALAVLFLWQLLRVVRVRNPGVVAGMSLLSLGVLVWADRFGLPVLELTTDLVPWWVGFPLLVTALTATWTALVCVLRKNW
jgi:hypothetical protein